MRQIYLTIFLLAAVSVHSQTFNYRNYSVENGLASSTVYVAIQDRKGFMWFATENGVNRFDGNHFEQFTLENGLSDNDVLRIFEDSRGRIWFLTANGHLSFYLDGKIHNEKTDPYLSLTYVASGFSYAFEDSKRRMWFCSINSQIGVLDEEKVIRIKSPTKYNNSGIAVFEDSLNRINVLCDYWRYIFDEKKQSLIHDSQYPGAVNLRYFMSPEGRMHFISFDGIYQVSNDSFNKVYSFSDSSLPTFEVVSATNSHDNTVYICTKNGALSFFPGNSKTKRFLPDKWINSVTVDKEDNIWFMTRGEGIYFLSKQYGQQKIYTNATISSGDIHSLAIGKNGTIWIGGSNNTVCSLSNDLISKITLPTINNLKGRIVYMDSDNNGNIWCCSDVSLYKISSTGDPIKMVTDPTGFRTLNFSFSSTSSSALAYSSGIGSIVEKNDHLTVDVFKDTALNKRTYCVFYDFSDHLFISNIDGLYKVVNGESVNLSNEIPLLKSKIISIDQTRDSSLVFGTDGYGVILYKNGKPALHVTTAMGLSSSICRRIRISNEKIFVCTNKGLTQFVYDNGKVGDFRIYGVSNGLPSDDVRDVIVKNGIIYVVTSKGLAVIEENASLEMDFPPGIYIRDVLNNTIHVRFDSTFTLPYRSNTITIKYSAITFNSPEDVIYEYSIQTDRVETRQTSLTELTFPDMSPGKYKFSVRAKKKNSEWSPFVILSFNVEYPYYRQLWFYLLIILLFVSGLTLIFVYLHRRSMRVQLLTLEKRNALSLERNRISEDMHDDLGAELSRIVVVSELIKFASTDNQSVHSNISKISEFATGATKKMEDIIWALNPQNDTLRSLVGYINRFCFNFFDGTGTTVEINTDDNIIDLPLNAKQRRNIFLAIKEIANNTMKYANAKRFFIHFKIEGETLCIEVGDDGNGFEESNVMENGNGLKNIRKRITELSGSVTLTSSPLKGTLYEISVFLDGTL